MSTSSSASITPNIQMDSSQQLVMSPPSTCPIIKPKIPIILPIKIDNTSSTSTINVISQACCKPGRKIIPIPIPIRIPIPISNKKKGAPEMASLWQKDGLKLKPTHRQDAIIFLFIKKIQKRFPNKYSSCIKPICDELDREGVECFYKLIYGLMQSGKSLAVAILLWIVHYKYRMYPIFLTKDLGSVRVDITEKLTKGAIIQILAEIRNEMKLNDYEWDQFTPKICSFKDIKADPAPRQGRMPIFLMQKDNYQQLMNYINRINKDLLQKVSTVFIVDEMHEYFTNQKEFSLKKGLTLDRVEKNPDALAMIHYIRNKVEHGLAFLIGVTATPHNILADTHLYPKLKDFIKLVADPPFPGAQYLGYVNNKLEGIDIVEYEKEVDVITTILNDRVHNTICPVVLITIDRTRDLQWDLLKELQLISPLVYVRTFFDPNNLEKSIPIEEITEAKRLNCKTIAEFYRDVPHIVKEKGVCVLIGKARLAAGVTVKPTDLDTLLPGLTAQIVGGYSSLPGTLQLVGRLFGWYPKNHKSTLYVPCNHTALYATQIISLHQQIIDKFNGHPDSVKDLEVRGFIGRITAVTSKNDLYYNTREKRHYKIEVSRKLPKQSPEVIEFRTTFKLCKSINYGDRSINSFHANGSEQTLLKAEFGINLSRFQVGYNENREKAIREAIVAPRSNDTSWQINGFLYGPFGPKTLIKDCFIVQFVEKHENRPRIKPGETIFFRVSPYEWMIISMPKDGPSMILRHKYIHLVDAPLTDAHYEALKVIDKIWEHIKSGKEKLCGWALFRKVRKELGEEGGGSSTACSPFWRINDTKAQFDSIANSTDMLDNKLEMGKVLYKKLFLSN